MASRIKDKVAIIGMGCPPFGEHWTLGPEDLTVDAFEEALADANMDRKDIQAAWIGNALDDINVGNSALPLTHALRLKTMPVSRVENMCATGTEALASNVSAIPWAPRGCAWRSRSTPNCSAAPERASCRRSISA